MGVRIEYQYRDGANYKKAGSWTVQGEPYEDRLMKTLHDGEFFVPAAVGMPMLSPPADKWDDEIDHPFHTITGIDRTDDPVDEERDFAKLADAFAETDWEAAAADHEMQYA